jgi:hypothetical protein
MEMNASPAVIAGLVPATHGKAAQWVAGTSPAMTMFEDENSICETH